MAQQIDKVFVIKAEVTELDADAFTFSAQKTMYDRKADCRKRQLIFICE